MTMSTSDPDLLNHPADADSPGGPPNLPLHLVGTQSFLPSLLARVRSMAAAPTLPLEQVMFQSILLCLIAGDSRHLILRTVEEDVGLVVKLVVWTLSCIFDIPTRRLRLPAPAPHSSFVPLTPTGAVPTPTSSFVHTPTGGPPTASWNNTPALASTRPKPKCAANDPGMFLRALFMPRYSSAGAGAGDDSEDEDEFGAERGYHHRRQYSHSGSHASKRAKHRARHGHAHAHAYTAPPEVAYVRSQSVPSNLVNTGRGEVLRTTSPESMLLGGGTGQQQQHSPMRDYAPSMTSAAAPTSATTSTTATMNAPPIFRPKPVYPTSLNLPHAYTDPLPVPARPRSAHTTNTLLHRRLSGVSSTAPTQINKNSETETGGPAQLPRALVLSGLEDATLGVQRTFAGVLSEGQVVLPGEGEEEEDKLAEGFFVVYVCPWSACERPGLHKSLLDKFAMSTNVFVPQNIRRDFHLLLFSLPKPLAQQQQQPPHQQSMQQHQGNNDSPKYKFFSHSNPGTPSPSQALALPQTYTPPVTTSALPPAGAPSSSMHRRASSHSSQSRALSSYTHHSQAPTHFTHHTHQTHQTQHTHRHSSHTTSYPPGHGAQSTYAHTHPYTPLHPSTSLFHTPPIPSSFVQTLRTIAAEHTYIAPGLSLYMADIFSAARHHSRLDGTLLGRAAMKDAEALVRASRVVGMDLTGMELLRPVGVAEVSEEGGDEDDVYQKGRNGTGQHSEEGDGEEEEDDDDDDDDYSSALDVSIHNEPLLSAHPPSVTESALPAPLAAMRTLDVSEVNIARIVPRVISHRVRLRSGPEEEVLASALFGATFAPPVPPVQEARADQEDEPDLKGGQGEEVKRTEVSVKAVLVQILAEV